MTSTLETRTVASLVSGFRFRVQGLGFRVRGAPGCHPHRWHRASRKPAARRRSGAPRNAGDDAVGNPDRAQVIQFDSFEFFLLLELDKPLSIERFEPTVPRAADSILPPPPSTAALSIGESTPAASLGWHYLSHATCLNNNHHHHHNNDNDNYDNNNNNNNNSYNNNNNSNDNDINGKSDTASFELRVFRSVEETRNVLHASPQTLVDLWVASLVKPYLSNTASFVVQAVLV